MTYHPAFCLSCNANKPFYLREDTRFITVRGVRIKYKHTSAICCDCGLAISVPEINDLNADARESAYRQIARVTHT